MRIRMAFARLAALLALSLVLSLATASVASAGAVQALPGCTDNTLPANDDDSTPAVALPFEVDFFGNPYTELYVNNNGNVTFDQSLGTYTPFDFTISGTPMIAPFLADVDTTGTGSGLVTYGEVTGGIDGRAAFCVNWVDVGYYDSHADKLNSFQLLLIQEGTEGDFDIVFNYDRIVWETGDASDGSNGFGGTPAAAGWASGDGEHFDLRPGSFDSMALLDSNTSTGLVHGMLGSTQPGRYVFPVRGAAVSGPVLEGRVQHDGGDDVINGPVEICPVPPTAGACRVRNTNQTGTYRAAGLQPGTYSITANPPEGFDGTPVSTQVTMGATDDVTAPILTLGPGPEPPPAGTSIESIDTSANGIPVVVYGTSPTLETSGCAGGTATFEIAVAGSVVASGSLTESPVGSGVYSGPTGALNSVGNATVTIDIDCPPGPPDETVEFGLYIDPSGHVRDTTGAPISGATVELFRSASPTGPFAPVPDGSAVMSPSNRTNPDLTNADGHFGWDVVAGYYTVRASKDGCVSADDRSQAFAETHVMTIPPPVTNLDIRLHCDAGGGDGDGGGGGAGGGGGSAGGGGSTAGGGGSSSSAALASLGTIKLSGTKVVVSVFCASAAGGACKGSLTIKAKSGKKKRAKRIVIGSAKFSGIARGTTKRVSVKLNRKGRGLLKKGKVKATVAMKVSAGGATAAQNVTRSVTLKKPKKRGRR